MSAPPLVRSVPLALGLGVVVGGILGGVAGFPWGWLWGLAGIAGGVVFGAISSLDLLIAGPGRSIGSHSPGAGPFRSMASFGLATLGSLTASAFFIGHLACDCTRRPNGEVDCVRTSYAWFDRQVFAQHTYPDVREVLQVRDSMVKITTGQEIDSGFLEGFDPTAADRIDAFLSSDESALHLESYDLWYPPWIFAAISCATAWLTIRCFRWGRIELLKQLNDPERVSATGW